MWGAEQLFNRVIFTPLSNVIGLPLILNGTEKLMKGPGFSVQNYTAIGLAFERIYNSTLLRKARKIYNVIRGKYGD